MWFSKSWEQNKVKGEDFVFDQPSLTGIAG